MNDCDRSDNLIVVKVWQYIETVSRIRRRRIKIQIKSMSYFLSKYLVSILDVSSSYYYDLLTWFDLLHMKAILNMYNFYLKYFSIFRDLVVKNRLEFNPGKPIFYLFQLDQSNFFLTGRRFSMNLLFYPGPEKFFLDP